MKRSLMAGAVFLVVMMGMSVFASFFELVERHFTLTEPSSPVTSWIGPQQEVSQFPPANILGKMHGMRSIWEAFNQAEALIGQDIPSLLQGGNRAQALDSYLRMTALTSDQLSLFLSSVTHEITTKQSSYATCENQLAQANSHYETSLLRNDAYGFEQAKREAQGARVCMGEAQVHLGASRGLQQKANRYLTQLQRRFDYLSANRDLIVQYYDLLQPDLLNKLRGVSASLEARQ